MSQIVSQNVVIAKGNFPAICESTFSIKGVGAFFAVVTGANGSGKTTLLKAIAGMSNVSRGEMTVNDIDVKDNLNELKKTATYVGHGFSYLDSFRVIEHLELNSKIDKISKNSSFKNEDYKLLSIDEALEFCQLVNRKNVYISDLSAGQQRRLQLASAFMRSVDMVLIDEPHASLDSASKDLFDELFASQFLSGRSLLIATHDPHRLENIATDFLEIENGVVKHRLNERGE